MVTATRTGCVKCPDYSRPLGRCRLGYANPKTIKSGVSAAQLFGLYYLCPYTGIRDRVAQQIKKGEAQNGRYSKEAPEDQNASTSAPAPA